MIYLQALFLLCALHQTARLIIFIVTVQQTLYHNRGLADDSPHRIRIDISVIEPDNRQYGAPVVLWSIFWLLWQLG